MVLMQAFGISPRRRKGRDREDRRRLFPDRRGDARQRWARAAQAPPEPEPRPRRKRTAGTPALTDEPEASAEPGVVGAPAGDPDPMARMEAMEPRDRWTAMVHGFAFVGYNDQGGPSGGDAFESQNHVMTMAIRSWLGGKISLLGTFSLEPATIPARGSPQLFQRGETYQGTLLVDRQHAHDLFAQLAAAWERKIWDYVHLRLYLAPVGEPAVGPTAFVHRLSASENPAAPSVTTTRTRRTSARTSCR
jgi:hypothetical protein